jgi:butyrate kinase
MKTSNHFFILTINPGSTSTKIGLFKDEELQFNKTIPHNDREISSFKRVWDQYTFRKRAIEEAIRRDNFNIRQLGCTVGRGGLFQPTVSGTYSINKKMLEDARNAIQGEHASNLGCVLAYGIGWDSDIPSFIVDPPCVDEMEEVARISGHAAIKRRSLVHALNIKAIARVAAEKLNQPLTQLSLIIAHLGGGISVTPLQKGRMIDTSEALGSGPFTPERSGYLPTMDFVEYIFRNKLTQEQAKKMLVGQGGMYSYLKTKSMIEADNAYQAGDAKFQLIVQAMAYQVSKEIGAMATTLKGEVDAIVLTGGAAHSRIMVDLIKEHTLFLVDSPEKFLLFPGEDELKALAQGALRVLRGEEKPLSYPQQIEYKDWFSGEN